MKRKEILVLLIGLAVLASTVLAGQTWVKLGKRTVNFRTDHDAISVSASKGSFHALRLQVERHAVRFEDLKIHFGNGSTKDVELKSVIQAGGHTRTIDFPGEARAIKRIEFVYKSAGPGPHPGPRHHRRAARNKARVEVWGLK